MPVIKTLIQARKMDREKFKIPRSVQQAVPIQRIWQDGIFQVGNKSWVNAMGRYCICRIMPAM